MSSNRPAALLTATRLKHKAMVSVCVEANLALSTTYRKRGSRSSMHHRKSPSSIGFTSCVSSSNVFWMTMSLSDGVKVVLHAYQQTDISICANNNALWTLVMLFFLLYFPSGTGDNRTSGWMIPYILIYQQLAIRAI